MSTTDARIAARWRGRLSARRALLAAARKRHEWLHNAASRALLSNRKRQVALAERVIARHTRKALPKSGISDRVVAFIADQEGGQSPDGLFRPYRDAVGVWTVGYGHTEHVGPGTRPLTKAQALALLKVDLLHKYAPPVLALKAPRQGITDGLVSAVYNLGPGILRTGTLGARIARRDWNGAATALLDYDHAGGRVLPGLAARRRAEAAMIRSR